ncbi:IS66 family insertion sequence element accessory protein TnpA [Desulforamulus aeronauticus]|uniref:Transposase n=1 Tax=Desulforamulus aeronauticus DSM 10349 TaxID=1121421 RepID=A0A1M6VBG2_9FIRM|nr:hypothetical protein [Desulforamulus aeronauticus]SHK78843.1 hypothetical protein SAMN02745123_03116 [Desulforamulus aeronauticus DSM 10349]
MNTREIAAEYRLAHWTQIVRRKTESGLSIKAFCASEGFRENTYYYWQRKLREMACEQLVEIQTGDAKPHSLIPPGFAELKITKAHENLPIQDDAKQGEIRIELGGMRIAADSAYPVEKITALLSLFKQLC